MNESYITFRSVTYAQRGEILLKRTGVACMLQRTPKVLAEKGCGYSLRIQTRDAMAAVTILREHFVSFGKLYAILPDGKTEEQQV